MGLSDQTILITGGSGFIGSHLVNRLNGSNEVRVLDNCTGNDATPSTDNVTLIKGDVRNVECVTKATKNVDLIFHQAAQVSVEHSIAKPRESHNINVDGTFTILERAREIDARVIVASSAAIYGTPESLPINEQHRKRPDSPYGLDKLTVDELCRLYHRLYYVDTVSLRYFNVYGPDQSHGEYSGVISKFLKQARDDDPITIHGDGTQTRDFVHIDDVVKANVLASMTGELGRAFNIASGSSVSINELALMVRDLADSDSEIIHIDPREGDIDKSEADISRARNKLDFQPEVPLRIGLSRIID